jgi:RsiW-degrading membrane proteinase PrsW (M82 family)
MSTIRRYVTPLAVIAAAIVLYIEAPWEMFGLAAISPTKDVETILSVVFWILAIVVAVALFEDRKAPGATTVEVEGPAFTRFLFGIT